MSEHTRIKFYSVHDLSFASNMKRVESFFEKWEQNTCSPDINTIIELYNIKQYFSTGRVLSTWSNEQLDEYQKKVSLIPGIIGRFCNSVLDEEWNCMFKSTEINYVDDFWTVIDNYKVYSKISANTIGSILDSNSDCVWYILRHRALSAYYGTVLTNHLLDKNYRKVVADMDDSTLEHWYDELYQMILLAFLQLDQVDRNAKILELKQTISSK